MPRDLSDSGARIGPNAVLQMVPVLDEALGPAERMALMARAGVMMPAADEMMPEAPAAALHRQLRADFPGIAPALAARAGRRTAEYILAHRIPAPVQTLLKALPAGPSARLLSRAIAKNAWTFTGSGRFQAVTPWLLELHGNPVILGEVSDAPLCTWHAAVFETLYRRLVDPGVTCREVTCAAQGAQVCRFALTR